MASTEFNHLPAILQALHTGTSRLVRKAAFDIEGHAKLYAAVDTGFMRSAIYVVTSSETDYGHGVNGDDGELLPQVDPPSDELEAYVAAGADYSEYVEHGTRHMAAQPFMAPAADAVRPGVQAAAAKLAEALMRAAQSGSGEGSGD